MADELVDSVVLCRQYLFDILFELKAMRRELERANDIARITDDRLNREAAPLGRSDGR